MTKKDYIKFANKFRQLKQDVRGNYIAEAHLQDFINETMDIFYLDNSNFNSTLFVIFSDNTELCKITEDLVFTEPYMISERNRWTKPYLDERKKEIEKNTDLKIAVNRLKLLFYFTLKDSFELYKY